MSRFNRQIRKEGIMQSHKKPLKWINEKPTVAGIYLRSNPIVKSIVRQDVFKITGYGDTLFVILKDGSDTLTELENISGTFF